MQREVQGEMRGDLLYAEVNVDVPAYRLDKPFHYFIPEELRHIIRPGIRVLVPFGVRKVEGYVTGLVESPDVEEVKAIEDVVDEVPILTEELLELSKWMANRYVCPQAKVIRGILPAGISFENVEVAQALVDDEAVEELLRQAPRQGEILRFLVQSGQEMEVGEIGRALDIKRPQAPLYSLQEKGLVELTRRWCPPKVRPKTRQFAKLLVDSHELLEELGALERTAPAQARILQSMAEMGWGPINVAELLMASQATYSSLRGLEKKGLIACDYMEVQRDPLSNEEFEATVALELTCQQDKALAKITEALDTGDYHTILLHGITGSGKTEVYLQAIADVLKRGRSAIVLVPEISLTPQMVRHFASRFGGELALLHSKLSPGERYDQWRKIRKGEVRIALGARSAVFAPFDDLGLIIIDEEHEGSYKQGVDPKYHARDVAIWRAKWNQGVVLLGSATPSLESYYQASKGRYSLATLKSRIDERPLPEVTIVDMRAQLKAGNRSIFSDILHQAIEERLTKGQQIILFLNRRGHSTFVMCRECGHVVTCNYCDLSLTYHHMEKMLRCHYCNYEMSVPDICPNCQGRAIKYLGIGTERVQKETKKAFPGASVLRMDSDTTSSKGSHGRILDAFGQGRADILVGTQMIAKGLDFPRVTLVGVILADTALHFPEFRAGERTFQLLTQVAGRAGRGQVPGQVIVQTYTPEHYSILTAKDHDYKRFYDIEIAGREELDYPPFSHLANIVVSHREENKAARYANDLRAALEGSISSLSEVISILGPTPAPLSRIKDRYRQQMLIKGRDVDQLSSLLGGFMKEFSKGPGARDAYLNIQVDIEPMSTL